MSKALVWFRRDLRVADNPALYTACQQHSEVRALYIDCPKQWQRHQQSARQQKFIAQHIVALRARLAKLGIPFEALRADLFDQVPALLARWIKRQQIDALYMNRDIGGVNEARRDAAVQKRVVIPCHIYQADCVIDPGTVLTKAGQMYQVFTPFCRAWLVHLQRVGYHVYPAPRRLRQALSVSSADKLATNTAWPIGEQAAQRRLKRFCQQGLRHYAEQRDIPANAGTSQLSPYLAIGVLSAAQCLAAVEKELGFLPLSRGESGFSWVNELVWREFYRHLLVAYPRLSKHQPFKLATEKLRWCDDDELFATWCAGRTGYPIVDAAMHCLNQTGWLHNRLRMVVASFLTKDLHIDWRRGETYFMQQLIDGDLASNNGGWQWAAGTGADAAPYFRIFNPTTQGKRFDPQGLFVKRWLPELAAVPARMVHTPHAWLTEHGQQDSYPAPIVDHALARQQALAMFAAI